MTWRTSKDVKSGYGEISKSSCKSSLHIRAETIEAITETINYSNVVSEYDRDNPKSNKFITLNHNYHSVTFKGLEPNTVYGYRVGDGEIWSEWIQFKTAHKENAPFLSSMLVTLKIIFLNYGPIRYVRVIGKHLDASFIIHAGDLINDAHDEHQWH